ncbi:MAG: hypothetical protein MJY56_04210 [Bacteroidales bacterium]|nr:hypothetical protein [Bacteroidales bacterium]
MKLYKVLFAALAATLLVACTDERKDVAYEAETQGEKIETALCEAALLLNPNFYYESVEAVAWLTNYCTHYHVADMAAVEARLGEILKSWETSSESEGVKTVRIIYQLSEFTGKFNFELDKVTGKGKWTAEDCDHFEMTWPSKDGISTTLTLKVKDGSSKVLIDGYEDEDESESIYLVLPKHVTAKLVKGGRTLSTANLAASYKLSNEDKLTSTDKLNFNLALDVEGYKAKFSRCNISLKDSKVSAKVSDNNNNLIAKGSATLKGMVWDDELRAPTAFGIADFNADVRGKVQIKGHVDIDAFMAAQNALYEADIEKDSKEVFTKINTDLNNSFDVVFYFDGFKTPQSHVVFDMGDPYYDEMIPGVVTYDNYPVVVNGDRISSCLHAFVTAIENAGSYECPECNRPL